MRSTGGVFGYIDVENDYYLSLTDPSQRINIEISDIEYELLLEQIQSGAMDAEAIMKESDLHGQRYRVDLEVMGTLNQRAVISLGWIVEPDSDFARLVTLYVKKQP